ncbi:MAG TPA: aldehyde dehydrogenase [Shigella sp.]|nr:aldehyde dehydrogenase [Shigella sp.]
MCVMVRREPARRLSEASSSDLSIWPGNYSNLLIVFYVQIMPYDFVMLLHRF